MNNTMGEEELELSLIELFSKATSLGFGMRLTKEEFAEAVKNGAIDHQEATHEAMKLIKQYALSKQIEARIDEVSQIPDNFYQVLYPKDKPFGQGNGKHVKPSERIAELRKQQKR